MKLKQILLIALLVPSFLVALVFESPRLTDILEEVDEQTLIISDIDNTLIYAGQQLGSPQCSDYFFEKFKQLGLSEQEASDMEMARWMMIQSFIKVKPVDEQADQVFQQLQEKGIPIIALTAREPKESIVTHHQLTSIAIHIKNVLASDESFEIPTKFPSKYDQGIIFCGFDNSKGRVLTAFLKQINFNPRKIIFIDDKLKHIEDVEKVVESMGIEYVGMRFSGSDQRIAELDPKIVDLQWTFFPKIISDEKAKAILNP